MAILAALSVVVTLGVTAYGFLEARVESARMVRHTLEVIARIERLSSTLKDAETGQRGYLLTGNRRYLGPYQTARDAAAIELEALETLTADNEEQQRRFASLRPIVAKKLDELARTITLSDEGKQDEATALVRTDLGQSLMEELRGTLVEARAHEEGLLRTRSTDFSRVTRLSLVVILGGLLLLGILTVLAAVAMAQDLRTRERVELERERALASRADFLAVSAHELRTPLTALALQVTALRRNPARIDAALDVMERQANRLARLIERMLHAMELEARRIEHGDDVVNFADLVRGAVDAQRDALDAAGCEVTLDLRDAVLEHVDTFRLSAVVGNLIGNAVRFGAGRPVEITLRSEAMHARLTVRDHGIGIAPEDQRRIFEPYERAVSTMGYGGQGLGLWLVREFVRAHGGTVAVDSRPGEGAAFTVTLPHTRSRAPSAARLVASPPQPA